jgi:hypothetical protein
MMAAKVTRVGIATMSAPNDEDPCDHVAARCCIVTYSALAGKMSMAAISSRGSCST